MLGHLDDVVSDLSALHRVDDWRTLPARRFFTLVDRLHFYPGIIAALRGTRFAAAAPAGTVAAQPEVQQVDNATAFALLGADIELG